MSDRLSSSDMSSLLAERESIHVHVGATMIMDGGPPDFEELLAHVGARLENLPRFRQRVTDTSLGISNPVWADDPTFELRRHVRHSALPAPGSTTALRDYVGRVMSEPLDLQHPLWQLYLIEGLEGRRHAYISKTHHALVDGVAAVDVGMILLDPKPDGAEPTPHTEPPQPDEADPELLFGDAGRELIRRPLRAAGRAAESALTTSTRRASAVVRTAEGFASLVAERPRCPRSALNVNVGRDRRVAFARAELGTIEKARGQRGATINDVLLSIAAGALGGFLRARGSGVPEHLVVLVPVSMRRPDQQHDLGSRISSILVELPLDVEDPAERLEVIRERTARLKESEQARASALIVDASGWAPPTINRLISGVLARPRVFNLVISNVPGPRIALELLGRGLREVYPFVPLSPQGHAVSIGALSYHGSIFIGLVGDRDVLPDLDRLTKRLEEAIEAQIDAPG
jgi:WS/DGAT/MGAT family acyltransferase